MRFLFFLVTLSSITFSILLGQEGSLEGRNGEIEVWVNPQVMALGNDSPEAYSFTGMAAPGVARFPIFGHRTSLNMSLEPEYIWNERVSISAYVPVAVVTYRDDYSSDSPSLSDLLDQGEMAFFQLGDITVNGRFSPFFSPRLGLRLDLSLERDLGTSKHVAVGDGFAMTTSGITLAKVLRSGSLVYTFAQGAISDHHFSGRHIAYTYGLGIYGGRVWKRGLSLSYYDTPEGGDLRFQAFLADESSQTYIMVTGLTTMGEKGQILFGSRYRLKSFPWR